MRGLEKETKVEVDLLTKRWTLSQRNVNVRPPQGHPRRRKILL